MRKEFPKTKVARNIYVSNEAARYLNEWLEWKYRLQGSGGRMAGKEDLVFARVRQKGHPSGLYNKMAIQFTCALQKAGYASRKEEGVYKRRNITFHSFRRFAKTTISNKARNPDYSEWFLGHAKSTYYTNKPQQLREIYEQDCMQFLTFLDFKSMEEIGKDIKSDYTAKIEQLKKENADKDRELMQLKQRDSDNSQRITQLEEEMNDLYDHIKTGTKRMKEESTPKLKRNMEIHESTTKGLMSIAQGLDHVQKMGRQMTDKQKLAHLLKSIENTVVAVQAQTENKN